MKAEQDYIAEFTASMAQHDIRVTGPIIADGKLHRIHVEGDHRSERNGWYVLHLDDHPTGQFGCNRRYGTDTKFTWSAKRDKKMTKKERDTLAAKFKIEQDRRLAEETARRAAAAIKANAIWDAAADADPAHPYLVKKGIGPHGLRQADWVKEWSDPDTGEVHETKVPNALLVPIKNASKEIVSLQAIFPDKSVMGRDKDFLTDGEKRGCFSTIGGPAEYNGQVVVTMVEGFATGAAVEESTGFGVVIAFDAGNLKPVAEVVRAKFPTAKIVIAADNDQWTLKPVNNPGLTRAREAATAVAGVVALPVFTDLQSRPTDFNDLLTMNGKKEVMEQIMSVVSEAVKKASVTVPISGPTEGPGVAPPAYSEDALALEFAERHLDEFRFVKERECWYVYELSVWREDVTGKTLDKSRKVCRRAAADPAATDVMSEGQIRSLAGSRPASSVLKLAGSDRRLALTADRFDCDLWALNTPAGIVDLRTGEMRPARPTDYMTKITTVGPDATCATPLWIEFLMRVTDNDQDLVAFLQRFFGYCLTGVTREQVLAFLFGTGANGKSVFLNTVCDILGDYHTPAPMETFTESKSDRHPTELASLQNARLVSAAETEEGRRMAEAKIKLLTGGDPIPARRMRQDFYYFTPQFKLVIAGNHKPSLRSVDESICRRVLLVPFTVTIPPEQRDKDLGDKLKAEWPGILAWLVEGCIQWQRIGLNPPAVVTDATRDYMAAEDSLSAWIDDRCNCDPSAWTSSRELYCSWKEWATDGGEFVAAEKRFVELLSAHGFKRHRCTAGRGFRGLELVKRTSGAGYGAYDGYDV